MNNNENLIEVPEFRAKKIDSDEYVIGYLLKDTSGYLRITNGIKDNKHPLKLPFEWIIDATTLAINFPKMLDSDGNKIFASLRRDGKGGDVVLKTVREHSKECIALFSEFGAMLDTGKFVIPMCRSLQLKVTGTKE